MRRLFPFLPPLRTLATARSCAVYIFFFFQWFDSIVFFSSVYITHHACTIASPAADPHSTRFSILCAPFLLSHLTSLIVLCEALRLQAAIGISGRDAHGTPLCHALHIYTMCISYICRVICMSIPMKSPIHHRFRDQMSPRARSEPNVYYIC